MPEVLNRCEFCGCKLHYNDAGTGWKENEKPNCLKNPSGPEYGHWIKTDSFKRMRS